MAEWGATLGGVDGRDGDHGYGCLGMVTEQPSLMDISHIGCQQ